MCLSFRVRLIYVGHIGSACKVNLFHSCSDNANTKQTAIIVESYMQVRREIEKFQVEQSFPEDLVGVMHAVVKQRWWGWPSPMQLGRRLDKYKFKISVSYADLEKTGLFPNHKAIVEFLNFYERYHFTKPEEVTKYGTKPRSLADSVAHQVEQRIAKMFGVEAIKLKDMTTSRGNKGREAYRRSSSLQSAMTSSTSSMQQMESGEQQQSQSSQRRNSQSVRNLAMLRMFAQQQGIRIHVF